MTCDKTDSGSPHKHQTMDFITTSEPLVPSVTSTSQSRPWSHGSLTCTAH